MKHICIWATLCLLRRRRAAGLDSPSGQRVHDRTFCDFAFKIKARSFRKRVGRCRPNAKNYLQSNWANNTWRKIGAEKFAAVFYYAFLAIMKGVIVNFEAGSGVFYSGWLDSSAESLFLTSGFDQIRGWSAHIPLQISRAATLSMMDCSEEVQCVSEEPSAQMELKKGMSIFIDVSKTHFKSLLVVQNWFYLHH